MKEELSFFEHALFLAIPVIFFVLVKFMRGLEKTSEEIETQKEIQTIEHNPRIENHYHTHDNRTVNIIVKDGHELKTVLTRKANQTKLIGD